MRSGDDDRSDMLGTNQRRRIERPGRRCIGNEEKSAFPFGRRLPSARHGSLQQGRCITARHAAPAAQRPGRRVRVSHEPTRHHIGAVANARRIKANGSGRDAESFEVIEPGDPGLIASDPGIVENRRDDAELAGEIGRINPAMGTVYDDGTRCLGPDAGDAVGGQDRRKSRQRSLPGSGDPAIMQGEFVSRTSTKPGTLRESFSRFYPDYPGKIASFAGHRSDYPLLISVVLVFTDTARDR